MPNQRAQEKVMFGGYIDRRFVEVADKMAEADNLRSRAEFLEESIVAEARRRGLKCPAVPKRYGGRAKS